MKKLSPGLGEATAITSAPRSTVFGWIIPPPPRTRIDEVGSENQKKGGGNYPASCCARTEIVSAFQI